MKYADLNKGDKERVDEYYEARDSILINIKEKIDHVNHKYKDNKVDNVVNIFQILVFDMMQKLVEIRSTAEGKTRLQSVADLLSRLEGQLEEYENYMKNKTNE